MKDTSFLRERRILRERYAEKVKNLTARERVCWELGFDYGVDDPGVELDEDI